MSSFIVLIEDWYSLTGGTDGACTEGMGGFAKGTAGAGEGEGLGIADGGDRGVNFGLGISGCGLGWDWLLIAPIRPKSVLDLDDESRVLDSVSKLCLG